MYEIGQAEVDAVAEVIKNRKLFRYRGGEGGFCDKFEAAWGQKIGVSRALLTSSGTAALVCGLVGLGVGPGDEVIVPAYTFMASALAVTAAGGIPVIAEVDQTLSLDPADVKQKITPRTKAIMPVHMLGRPCDMKAFETIAQEHSIAIIEDACQAAGGTYRGRRLGAIGKVGAFSFNHFKILSGGEGGAMTTSDPTVVDRALIYHDGGCIFRDHSAAMKTPFFAGTNFRASEILGAIMLAQQNRLDGILARLRQRQTAMTEIFETSGLLVPSPANEKTGDCGCVVGLLFDSIDRARALATKTAELKLSCHRPIDSDRHVYLNWEPIMKQQGSHHPDLNPFAMARRNIEYSRDMCPRTLDILARTLIVDVPYDVTVPEAQALAQRVVACARTI
jgi:dTDP-4-amino-4,6-dideoxygalactose transaminase